MTNSLYNKYVKKKKDEGIPSRNSSTESYNTSKSNSLYKKFVTDSGKYNESGSINRTASYTPKSDSYYDIPAYKSPTPTLEPKKTSLFDKLKTKAAPALKPFKVMFNDPSNDGGKFTRAKPTSKQIGDNSYFNDVNNSKKQLNLDQLYKSNTSDLKKTLYSPLAALGTVGNWVNGDLQNSDGTTTGTKLGGRILDSARSASTGGAFIRNDGKQELTQPMDTGNAVGNIAGDLVGMGLGFGVQQPLMNNSLGGAMSKIGQPLENGIANTTSKLGLNPANPWLKVASAGLKTGGEFGALNGAISVGRGDTAKETAKNTAEGFGSGFLFGAGGKAIGLKSQSIKEKPQNIQKAFDTKFGEMPNNSGITKGTDLKGTFKRTKIEAPKVKAKIETPIKATQPKFINPKGKLKTTSVQMKNDTLPLKDRDIFNVGDKKVNAYQHDNPTVKPYMAEEAQIMKGEIERGSKPTLSGANTISNGQGAGHDTVGYGGVKAVRSESTSELNKLGSYKEINKALDDIIEDHGKENYALAKKVELTLDDRLSNGYREDVLGHNIPKNSEYLQEKAFIDGMPQEMNTSTIKKGSVKPKAKPKSDLVSANMGAVKAKQPTKITNIKVPGQEVLKPKRTLKTVPKKAKTFTPPTDANGNLLADPKIVSSTKPKTTFKQKFDNLYTSTVDNNNPTAKFSKAAKDDTFIKATNSASHKDISNNIINESMVNQDGVKIGKSLKELYKGKDNKVLEYALEKHNIARSREGKPIFPNRSSEQSAKLVAEMDKANPKLSGEAKEITKWISDFMDEWSVKSGTIDKGLYEANKKMYPDYIPTNREFSSLEALTKGNGSSGFANQTISINKATGSARDIIDPKETIADMVERTIKGAKNNEVIQSMVNSIRKQPDKLKGFAEIVGEPKGNVANVIRVLEKGKPTYVQINDEALLKNILGLNKTIAGNAERTLRKVMNVPKALITHKNPIFAFRNFFRDLPTAYTYGSEKNPIKFGKNFLSAYKDIATNSDIYKQFKGVGGQGGNFFDNGDSAKSIKKLLTDDNWLMKRLKDIPKGIEGFNNITESAPRLAEFKTVLKKTGDLQKALYAAKDVTTNFGRSGNFTKHVDSGVMYLNAGVQGLDKMAREFKHNPVSTIGKGLVGITAPTLVVNKMNKGNPNYEALTDRQKDSYFNFPNPSDGGKTFIKIPKSRELGVIFSTLQQRFERLSKGEKEAFRGFGNTVATNFSPANPIENNLIAPAFINIPKNKDFADRSIVPMGMEFDKRSPNLQYDERTTELSKWFGDKMKNVPGISDTLKSPKKLDYLMGSYLGVLDQIGSPLMTKSFDKSKTPLKKVGDMLQRQFIADPTFSNQTVTNFYDNMDRLTQEATDNNLINKIDSKTLTKEEEAKGVFLKASREMSEINKKIKVAKSDAEVKNWKLQIIKLAEKANSTLR